MNPVGPPIDPDVAAEFRKAYAALREREGRGHLDAAQLLALPYLTRGPWAWQWRVRARTYDGFIAKVLTPLEEARAESLQVLDLGSGNGWLSYRLRDRGHRATAIDWRYDDVDGLGAAQSYAPHVESLFPRVAASFDALPFPDACCDLAVFNASLHYSTGLPATLAESARVLAPGGVIAVLDSPFYRSEMDGAAMVAEKRTGKTLPMGDAKTELLGLPCIEFLTRERLETASGGLGLEWRRHAVRYPLRYELRPLVARIRARRPPSRFDVWEGRMAS